MEDKGIQRYLILFIPWALALIFQSDAVLSYFIAWGGSFFIFYLSLSGTLKKLPTDRTIPEQLMRPIFLVQIIFAGYMCVTSIFYFFSILGYDDFHKTVSGYLVDQTQLQLTAQCQRYYCLAHASLTTGMLIFMKYPVKRRYYIEIEKLANLLLYAALLSFPISEMFLRVPGLSQFYFQFNTLSFIAGTLALAFAIPLKMPRNIIICLILYASNFYQAFISGYKEPIILSVLVLGIFLYPNYKKMVAIVFVPAILFLFVLLPTFNTVFRANAWAEGADTDEATQLALDAALNGNNPEQKETNWDFLTQRLSEIDMFTKFVASTPKNVDYYKQKMLIQSTEAIIPRIFWPGKPNTEDMIMERVYNAGVINRNSNVSAKPAFVADAYLCFGPLGIFIFLFAYGALAQKISMKAEELFGGYIMGTALIFSGLFQIMWRGNCFEFLINTLFWSYMTMLVISKILRTYNILKVVENPAN
jgi:uncharacterized membrane protein